MIALAVIQGLMLMLYCEERSGAFQVESMGAAFTCAYFMAIIHIKHIEEKSTIGRSTIVWTLVSAFFAMGGVMMKEPFVLLMISGALIICERPKDIIGKIIIPLFTGGIMALILLLICGVLPEYFQIYLKNMFGSHINIYGSPFARSFNFNKLSGDIINFSKALMLIIAFAFVICVLYLCFNKTYSLKMRIWKAVSLIFAVWCASFAVGMGGQYYNHHYIFAAPLYMILIISEIKIFADIYSERNKPIIMVITFALIFCLGSKTNLPFAGDYTDKYTAISKNAEYVDLLLERYGETTYQFLGFNGEDNFCGLTKYSPQGPIFAQDPNNFLSDNTWAAQKLIEQLNSVNIVIFQYHSTRAIEDKVESILNTQFAEIPSYEFEDIRKPASFNYKIYCRKNN